MNDADRLVAAGRQLSSIGLAPGTTGNISVRGEGAILCSPTGARLGALAPDALSVLDLDGASLAGPAPTKESWMHVACYRAAPRIGAVVHLHSTYAAAWSTLAGLDAENALPPLTPYLTMKAGRVRLVPYSRPGAPGLAEHVGRALSQGARALLLANHGSLVAARTLPDAIALAEELEESAKVALIVGGRAVRALSEGEVAELLPGSARP